ncbi:MFS transporter [Streptomyces zhihengii]
MYLAGVVVSGFGTSAMWLAAGVWVKSLTGSDSLAALTAFAMWAPTLAGPLLGAVADRFRRRPLLVWSNLAMAVLLLPLLAVDSAGRVWILFTVLAVYGAVSVMQDAAEAGIVTKVVDARLLGDVNGLRMAANEGMKLVAPLVGVALFTRFGGASVALLDIVSFAAAAGVFALLRVREEPPGPRRAPVPSPGRGRRAGVAAFAGAGAAGGGGAAAMALAGINGALVFAVTDSVLDRSPAFTGVLYTAQGAGSVLCGLLAGPLLRRAGERRLAAAGWRCSRCRWRCGRCRTTRWRWCAARGSVSGCRACCWRR